MNKTRIFGITIIIIGIISFFSLENDLTGFISGILIGLGVGMTINDLKNFKNKISVSENREMTN
ncbi:hypothetical protein [uncultured Lutibacter sp.]|uniref:hypothetical protein n=1 Tax=uncultured Lutibacter sp. TaxID=437739 RepID=UPI002625BD77|nr:hypothetical protein [uncultured Lutibacter sp.]